MGAIIRGIIPIGEYANPAHTDVYPKTSCNNCGIKTIAPEYIKYAQLMARTPMQKLRDLNKLRSINGLDDVASQIIKRIIERTDIIHSETIRLELNQSRSLPLSSIICKQPTPRTSKLSPIKFSFTGTISVSLPLKTTVVVKTTIIPKGTFIKNIHPQLKLSQIYPPKIGPNIGAIMTVIDHKASAIFLFLVHSSAIAGFEIKELMALQLTPESL